MAKCCVCRQTRGYVYTGPVYAAADLSEPFCPWCIGNGEAYRKFEVTFTDSEALADEIPAKAVEEILGRTPGFNTWQSGYWPACCGDATAFLSPLGSAELRASHHELEGQVLSYIVHGLRVSGGAALRLLESLQREKSPTLFLFQCGRCEQYHFHIEAM
jgi:uncharacterized protein CbrC (UPF0167 family)